MTRNPVKYIVLVCVALAALAACDTVKQVLPEPVIQTFEVKVPVPVPCPLTVEHKDLPATDDALKGAAGHIKEETALLVADRKISHPYIEALETALKGCNSFSLTGVTPTTTALSVKP